MLALLTFLSLVVYVSSFQLHSYGERNGRISSPSKHLAMMSSKSDPKNEGYGPFGSLIRQGPVPFFIRIVNPSTYEAAVEKYMRLENCDRATAQGNMDAYFQDPNGWAGNKLRARKSGKDLDYANMNTDPKQLVLTAIWAVGILSLFYRIFEIQVLSK